jgi:hypothetical protein
MLHKHLCCDESTRVIKLFDIFVLGRNGLASNKIQYPVSLQNMIPSIALDPLSIQSVHVVVISYSFVENSDFYEKTNFSTHKDAQYPHRNRMPS